MLRKLSVLSSKRKYIDFNGIERFRKLGLIDEIALRNYFIRKEFEELRDKKIKVKDAILLLAEKYHLSESSINMVVYGKL